MAEIKRKLCSVQVIKEINNIPNADAIECATVLGWQVVVKKGEFQVGDKCLYVEIDSLLPPNPAWDGFMAKCKYRVKTIRLRGQVSQGLILPLLPFKDKIRMDSSEGTDVTEELGVTKWESKDDRESNTVTESKKHKNFFVKFLMRFKIVRIIHAFIFGRKVDGFPNFIGGKTDEPRIQNMSNIFNKLPDEECYVSEKVDGCSGSFYVKKDDSLIGRLFGKIDFFVCSRNLLLESENGIWWEVAKKQNIKSKLIKAYEDTRKEYCLQGECLGKVQGNKYKLKENDLYIFTIYNITDQKRLNYYEIMEFIEKYQIQFVPIIETNFTLKDKDVKFMVDYADGFSKINSEVLREGVVVRSKNDSSVLSVKAISNKFLLKFDI